MNLDIDKVRIFNTPIEVGVRILILLSKNHTDMDLQRIIYYDYFLLYLHDAFEEFENLHPSNPYHATEIAVRRELIQQAIKLMCLKGLVDIKYCPNGIRYSKNHLTEEFLSYFGSQYFYKLNESAKVVTNRFENLTDTELGTFVVNNIGKWMGEFEKEYQ